MVQMLAELDVAPPGKSVPHDAPARPEEGDEAVHTLCVAKRFDVALLSTSCPAALDFAEEFSPFLVLESEENFFLIELERCAYTAQSPAACGNSS